MGLRHQDDDLEMVKYRVKANDRTKFESSFDTTSNE